ncbi:hypothetical protein DXG01_008145 [Tephrocybe rancida]|nr:hypothetical protein DXG01_008145 [Tephrocybe rancida]
MPGANYMGGKRNAAKARAKDSTGRIQKGYFGRKRLNMLSNGIPGRTSSRSWDAAPPGVDPGPISTPRIAIELAHAPSGLRGVGLGERRKVIGKRGVEDEGVEYVMGKGTRTPRKREGPTLSSDASSAKSSAWEGSDFVLGKGTKTRSRPSTLKTPDSKKLAVGSSGARSRLLDILDTTEPMLRRATLNRILAVPDLAGLSTRAPKRRVGDADDARQQRKRQLPTRNPTELLHLTRAARFVAEGQPRSRARRLPRPIFSLADFNTTNARSKSAGASSLPPSSEQTSSSFMCTSQDLDQEQDPSFNGGFDLDVDMDFERPRTPLAHSESPGQASMLVSPLQNNSNFEFEVDHQTPPPDDRSPSVLGTPSPPRRHLRFAENNLYEHADPWHTIGVILGVSPPRPSELVDDKLDEDDEMGGSGAEVEEDGGWRFLTARKKIQQELEEEEEANDARARNSDSLPFWTTLNGRHQGPNYDEDEDTACNAQTRNSKDRVSLLLGLPSYWTAQDDTQLDLDDDDDNEGASDIQLRNLCLPPWTGQQHDFDEEDEDEDEKNRESDFDPLSCTNSSARSVRALSPAVGEEPQSPFRILLELNRKKGLESSLYTHSPLNFQHLRNLHSMDILSPSICSSTHSMDMGTPGLLAPFSSDSHSPTQTRSSPAPRTPSPTRLAPEVQSPFRMLLTSRRNLTDYSFGDSDPARGSVSLSSPKSIVLDFASSKLLQEVDGIFQGPCLFPDDDDSDDD